MTLTLTAKIGQAASPATSAVRSALSELANSERGALLGLQAPAAVVSIEQNLFSANLEKHLDDVEHGQGYLSSEVASQLFQKQEDTSALLSQTNPAALKDYSGYLTVLGYDSKARYVTAIDDTTKTLNRIPSEEEAKAATDELVKLFYPDLNLGGVEGK